MPLKEIRYMAPKSIFRNTVFKLLLNICNIIVPILVGPYITRVLDKEVYGTYNAANAAFAIFLSIGSLGLYNYGMREISRVRDNKAAADKLFSELLVISLISNVVVSAVYIAYALLTTTGTTTLLYVLFAIQFIGNAVYIEWVNEAMENYRFITVKTVVIRALYVAAMFLFVRKGSDLLPYTLILSLTYTVNCLASFFYVSRKIRISFRGLRLLPHLRPLLIVFIIMNVSVLFTQIDKIMLGYFVGEVAVSVYQIPHYIMSMIYSLAVAVAAVSMPRLSNVLHAEGPDAFLRLHRNVSRSFLFLLFPACVGVFVLAREIILLYGSAKYLECVLPIALFAIAYIPIAYTYLFGDVFLYIAGYERILALFHLGGGVTNVALNFLLIGLGKFTVETAIATLAVAFGVVTAACTLFIRFRLKVPCRLLDRYTVRYLLLSLTFLPLALLIKQLHWGTAGTAALTVAVCAGVYIGTLILLKDQTVMALLGRCRGPVTRLLRKK